MTRSIVLFGLLAGIVIAQYSTPTAVFPSPGSQGNSSLATLAMSATVQGPGDPPTTVNNVIGAGSLSTTLCYTSFGTVPIPGPGSLTVGGSISGTPNFSFVLAIGVQPFATQCGSSAGLPACMNGPLLLSSVATPFGLYHLGPNPIIFFDGLFGWPGTIPGVLDASGTFSFSGTIPVDTLANGGIEQSLAIQALVVDPTAAFGLSLTAALTVSQWTYYL